MRRRMASSLETGRWKVTRWSGARASTKDEASTATASKRRAAGLTGKVYP